MGSCLETRAIQSTLRPHAGNAESLLQRSGRYDLLKPMVGFHQLTLPTMDSAHAVLCLKRSTSPTWWWEVEISHFSLDEDDDVDPGLNGVKAVAEHTFGGLHF